MVKQQIETMAAYIGRLTLKEQAIISALILATGNGKYSDMRLGLLPFVPLDIALDALCNVHVTRPIAVILSKLDLADGSGPKPKILLRTTDVIRFFGARLFPKTLSWLPIKTIKGKPASHIVKLTLVKPDGKRDAIYTVHVHKAYRDPVLYWLTDTMQSPGNSIG